MKVVLIAAALAAVSGAAQAEVPAFAVTCGKAEVAAAASGPVTVNGKEAKITVQKDDYIEAKKGKVTYAVSIGADNAVTVTFANKKGEKGTCAAKA